MNELTINDLESVFGSRLKTISDSLYEMKSGIGRMANVIGSDITKKIDLIPKTLEKLEASLQTLSQKISDKSLDGKNTKVNDVLDKVSNTITASQKDNTEKLTSNFSYNFRSLNDQLKLVNDLSIESNREQLAALQSTIDQKIEKLTAVIQGGFTPQKRTETKQTKQTNTTTELLLTQQLMMLEKLKSSVDKKLTATLDAVSSTEKLMSKKAKRDLLNPPEIALSKKDRKLLQAIDANDEVVALTKEIKESKKLEPGSGIGKFLSPFLMLLGGIGAIAFAAFKFPSIKKIWGSFTQTKIGSGLMDIMKNATPKGMNMKEFVRSIPLIGRLVDLWDALELLHKGKTKEGMKRLAFVVPGMEFLAVLFGSTKERMVKPYDKGGDKSTKIFGFSIEQLWHGLFDTVDTVFKPVIEFFMSAFGALGEGFNLVMKGGSMNYEDIATTWDKITTDYFPSLKPVANIFKWLAKSAFDWTAGRMGIKDYKMGDTGEMVPLDIGDVISNVWERISELFTQISNKVQEAFNYVKNIVSALGMVFSGEKSQQLKGLGLLERQGMGGLADGISIFLNVIDSVKNMAGEDGKIGMWELAKGVWNGVDVTSGPFSRENRRRAAFDEADQEQFQNIQEKTKKMDALVQGYTDLQKQEPIEEMDVLSRMLLFKNARVGLPKTKKEKEEWLSNILNQMLETNPELRKQAADFVRKTGESVAIPAYEERVPELREAQKTETKPSEESTLSDAAQNAAISLYNMKQTADSLTSAWNNIAPSRDNFNLQADGVRTLIDHSYEETQRQTQALLDQNNILREQLQVLKESTLESKKGNQFLEATTKGISFLAEKPQGPVVFNNSTRSSVIPDSPGSALSFKSLALNSRGLGITP